METRIIDSALLPAFRPYLIPEAAEELEEAGILACGAVTEDHRTCGAACVEADEDGVLLCSLFIDPQVRRQGVATLLLNTLEQQLGRPITDAEWFAPQSQQAPLQALLEKRGLEVTVEEQPIMRLDCTAMQQLPVCRRAFQPGFRPDPNVIPFSEITTEEWQELLQDDTISRELQPQFFETEVLQSPLSMAYRYHGTIAAYFLAVPVADGAVVKAAVSRSMAHGGAFFQLAAAAMHNSLPYLKPGSGYWLEAVNDASETLARYLCKDHLELWYEGYAERLE